ncbi:MAG TPA: prepilin-type N-terminal cleavage/methylation domain-containing protein [Candidatus Paceibacterota bacterium]|nr:prepilin-type N-terminal cleavage/methylation domain-containing protein [Candidatus Paceibacterota bacterium]
MESLSHLRVLALRRTAPRGFTLIEMLVVLAIIIIVTAIALAGQSGFNRTEALNNMAYDIGLAIRQAESYGISNAINAVQPGTGNNIPYGISFDIGSPTNFNFFADISPNNCGNDPKPDCKPGDGAYGPGDTLLQSYTLNNGFSINAFCVTNSSKTSCTNGSGNSPLQHMTVTFSRPNAQVTIAGQDVGKSWVTNYTFMCVQLYSQNKETRYVGVSQNGEILAGPQLTADPNYICPKK